jgi:hypothetical protein
MRRVLFVLLLAAPVAAHADPIRDQVVNGVLRCDQIADNRAWLDCFYGSAQPMRASLGLSPAPQARMVPPPTPGAPVRRIAPAPPPPQPKQSLWSAFIGNTAPPAVDMPMASYDFGRGRTFTVTLQDGQVYQQKSLDTVRANWRGAPASYRVTVTRAPDGYMLRVKGETGTVYHVTRLDRDQ